MKATLRFLVAVLAGLLVSFLLVIAVELLGAVVHPVPEGFDSTSQEQMCLHVERIPTWFLAAAVPMWAFTAFAGTWLAGRIGNVYAAVVVGLLLLAGLGLNLAQLPYPIWFKLVTPLALMAAIVSGGLLSRTSFSATLVGGESSPPDPESR